MTYIFIVTSGSYSDKGNVAAFTTKEKAEQYIKYCNDFGSPNVNEWIDEVELDPDISNVKKRHKFKFSLLFHVEMERDGNIVKINQEYISMDDLSNPENKIEYTDFRYHTNNRIPISIEAVVNADTKIQAVKIVNDKRRQLIAENRWGTI